MNLFLLRHGVSGKRIAIGSGDPSLTASGKQDIAMIARSIKTMKLRFDAIITSPLKRAIQTANIVAKVLGMHNEKNKMAIWNELAPEGNGIQLCNRLRREFKMESNIRAIGHEPYLSNLIYEIISHGITLGRVIRKGAADRRGNITLKKAGFAKVRIISLTPPIKGELRWLLTPRILKSLIKKGRDGSKSDYSSVISENIKIGKLL